MTKTPGQHLNLAGHLSEPAAFDEFGQCNRVPDGGAEFDVLDEDRDLAQQRVAAAVVEVQVAVRGKPDVRDLCPAGRQRLTQSHPAGQGLCIVPLLNVTCSL